MTPTQFDCKVRWLGWRALSQRILNLRPAEAHALVLMMQAPDRTVTLETLATFDGDGMMNSRHFNGSRSGIHKRIERLRAKLSDVGCDGVVETVADHRFAPTLGFRISAKGVGDIDATLRGICGVQISEAA